MNALDVYGWLTGGGAHDGCDGFDTHVVASMLAIGVAEAEAARTPVPEAVGLSGEELATMVAQYFPHAAAVFARIRHLALAPRPEEEECLRDLLRRYSTEASPLQMTLADMMARRAMQPNHLWQDLGLRNRRELSWLMERHFEALAQRNSQDMKWKKFLYRAICRDDGFRLCTAPVCTECDDFEACFGDEGGESLLARTRRAAEMRA